MLRCSAEAFARCPTRHLCERREDATFAEGSECDLFNRQVAERPMTNGDRVRAMDDLTLARFLAEVENRRAPAGGGAKWKGVAHALQWLKAPAEVLDGK